MMKILLVDDEYHVISHIASLLEKIEFCEINTLQTTSGPEALKIVASSHIDIAFLDIPDLVHTILEACSGCEPPLARTPAQTRSALDGILARDSHTRQQAAAWRA